MKYVNIITTIFAERYRLVRKMDLKSVMLSCLGVLVMQASTQTAAINLTPLPPYISESKGAPMMMLNMSKDHQLFFKAYNEFSDLDDDGVIETQYKHSYKYYGYFDNQRCYTYNTASNRFVPVGKVDAQGYCTNAAVENNWNGNFMNWGTMARMDVVRRILYGGFRAVDTTTAGTPSVSTTVLERAHLPSDAHAFAKYYYGTDINKLTPFSPPTTEFTIATATGPTTVTAAQITMCNVSYSNDAAPATTNDGAPSILVAEGNHALWGANERFQCYWRERVSRSNGNDPAKTGIYASSQNPRRTSPGASGSTPVDESDRGRALGTGYEAGTYTARVEVCKTGLTGGFTSDEESRCRLYPRGNYKPVGLLQKYGEKNEAAFGLMTGSFDKNISGGVLRKNVSTFTDEVNLQNGIFTSVNGIVKTLDKLRVTGYSFGTGVYEELKGGCNFQQIGLIDGECRSWGNPMGEMYLESLRYLAGGTANADFTVAGAPRDTALGLSVTTWTDPFADSTRAQFGDQLCRPTSVVNFNGSVVSFDSNSWSGTAPIANLSEATVNDFTNLIGTSEGLYATGTRWAVGVTGSSPNGLCTAKTLAASGSNSLAEVTGICPEAPTQRGSYKMAGAALHAHIKPIRSDFTIPANNSRAFKVDTYGVALATGTPRIKVPVPGAINKFVFISPSFRLDKGTGGQGGGTLVDFKVLYQTATRGKYLIVWEDSEQGGDFDQDAVGTLEYAVDTNTKVIRVTTAAIAQSTGGSAGLGYSILGTNGFDGAHFHSGINNFKFTDSSSISATPTTKLNASGGCNNCVVGEPATAAAYDMVGVPGSSLKDPLWYAAKYGGFDRTKVAGTYVPGAALPVDAWDLKSADGSIGADGTPDNYFLAVDPGELEKSLAQVFGNLVKAGGSAPAPSPARVNVGGFAFVSTQVIGRATAQADAKAVGEFLRYSLSAQDVVSAAPDWDAGLKLTAQNWDTGRRIITMSGTSGIPFRWDSLDAAQKVAMQTNPQTNVQDTETIGTNRLNWLRGDSSNETVAGGLRIRPGTKLGAIINSSPWYLGAPAAGYSEEDYGGGYASFSSDNTTTRAVFVAANDGMLHAFNADSGDELFAYVPRGLYTPMAVAPFSKLPAIAAKTFELNAGTNSVNADGSVMVADMKVGGNWAQYLFGTLGRGGKGVYALDVTKPQNVNESASSIAKLVKWEYNESTNDPDLGYIVSRPTSRGNLQPFQTGYMANGKWAAIYGNGYNSTSGKAALYIFFAEGPGAGTATWVANTHYVKIPVGAGGIDNGLSIPTAVDVDNNGTIDTIYAGDLKGNVWKFDVKDTDPANWKVATTGQVPLYQAKTSAAGLDQPITTAIQPFRHPSGGIQLVFSTGKMLESIDYPMAVPYTNTVYGIREPVGAITTLTTGRSDLINISTTFATIAGNDVRFIAKSTVDYTTKKGWFVELTASSEAVVFNPVPLSTSQIYIRSIGPSNVSDGCKVPERALDLYLNVISGTPLVTNIPGAPLIEGYSIAGDTKDDRYDISPLGIRSKKRNESPETCSAPSATCACNPDKPTQCEVIDPKKCLSWDANCLGECSSPNASNDGNGLVVLSGYNTVLACPDKRLTWREIIRNR